MTVPRPERYPCEMTRTNKGTDLLFYFSSRFSSCKLSHSFYTSQDEEKTRKRSNRVCCGEIKLELLKRPICNDYFAFCKEYDASDINHSFASDCLMDPLYVASLAINRKLY